MSCPCTNSEPVDFDIFVPVLSGDTMRSAPQIQIDDDDDTLDRVVIEFKRDPSQATASLSLASANGDILINNSAALAWDFEVVPFTVSLDPGVYYFRVYSFNAADERRTPIVGELKVL